MNVHPLPEPVVDTIKERLRRGDWTHLEIAKDLGLSRNKVDKIARDHGFSKAPPANSVARGLFPAALLRMGDLSWQDQARCVNHEDFLDKDEKGPSVAAQKKVCWEGEGNEGPCPVRMKCLDHALAAPYPWEHSDFGMVFGGLEPPAIQALKKRARKRRGQEVAA